MLKTMQGKNVALDALQKRRKANETRKRIDNSSLCAGSPMHFDCIGCGSDIVVAENYVTRPKLCEECQALKDVGWME